MFKTVTKQSKILINWTLTDTKKFTTRQLKFEGQQTSPKLTRICNFKYVSFETLSFKEGSITSSVALNCNCWIPNELYIQRTNHSPPRVTEGDYIGNKDDKKLFGCCTRLTLGSSWMYTGKSLIPAALQSKNEDVRYLEAVLQIRNRKDTHVLKDPNPDPIDRSDSIRIRKNPNTNLYRKTRVFHW
jgi:hypothetical protein